MAKKKPPAVKKRKKPSANKHVFGTRKKALKKPPQKVTRKPVKKPAQAKPRRKAPAKKLTRKTAKIIKRAAPARKLTKKTRKLTKSRPVPKRRVPAKLKPLRGAAKARALKLARARKASARLAKPFYARADKEIALMGKYKRNKKKLGHFERKLLDRYTRLQMDYRAKNRKKKRKLTAEEEKAEMRAILKDLYLGQYLKERGKFKKANEVKLRALKKTDRRDGISDEIPVGMSPDIRGTAEAEDE